MVGVSAPESTSPRRHPAAPAATGAPPSRARPAHASGRASNAGRAFVCARLRPARTGQRRPQTPAGLGCGGLGSAPASRPVPLRVTDGLKRRPGWFSAGLPPTCRPWPCRSKMASNAGRAVGVRGSSGAWVGRGRAGAPPHKLHGAGSIGARRPCVQFAAGAPRHDPTPRSRTRPTAGGEIRPSPITGFSTVTTVIATARHKDPSGTVCLFPTHRRDDADETEGRGRVGVPPQQTAHTAVLKRLTPHLAVCEEVPRPGPARPTRRTHREPHSPAGD
ncbi:hypothetical protein Salbus254_5079 [Streptomyces albidoflavus]|nr:hypothetical protein Salbus254_5079 [Streptomyces albidoflavus]